MSDRAPYSRVYWSIQHDEKFDGIREDMRLIGSWLTLLVCADQSYPAPAYPPPIVPRSALKALTEAGLIDALSGGRYYVHGLAAERDRRRDAATTRGPNGTRTVPKRVANGDLDETRTSRDETSRTREPIDRIVDVWLSVKYRLPTERQRAFLHSYLQAFDQTGEVRAERAILSHPGDPIAAMKDELADFRGQRAKALDAEVAKEPVRRKPGLPQSARDILEEMKRLDAEKGLA